MKFLFYKSNFRQFFLVTSIFLLSFNEALFSSEINKKNSLYLEMQKGENSAPVVMIEYASLTCSHCAEFYKSVFPKLKKNYIDKGLLRLVHREIYFDRAGLWAALIARCSNNNDKYFGILKILYEDQAKWSRSSDNDTIVEELLKISAKSGMSRESAISCLEDEKKALDLVKEFKSYVKEDEIESTPTFIINGSKYSNRSFEDIKEIIDQILGKNSEIEKPDELIAPKLNLEN